LSIWLSACGKPDAAFFGGMQARIGVILQIVATRSQAICHCRYSRSILNPCWETNSITDATLPAEWSLSIQIDASSIYRYLRKRN
jgi:hypothetical protein